MKEDPDMASLVDALRADLPSERDAERVRARLAATGIAVGAALTTEVAAGSAVLAKGTAGGLVADMTARFAALSWVSKVGLAAAVSASAVGAPVLVSQMGAQDRPAASANTAPKSAAAKKGAVKPSTATPVAQTAEAVEAPETVPEAVVPEARVAATPKLERAPREPLANLPNESSLALPSATKAFPELEAKANDSAANSPLPVDTTTAARSTLTEETSLIDGALAALRNGDADTAQRFVDEHARRFPNGLLFRERERARLKIQQARSAVQRP